MKSLPTVARVVLGLIFFVFGLNGFFNFLPPPEVPEAGGRFLGALMESGYLWSVIKGTEAVAGLLLLTGRFVPLALTVLAPIVVNIVLFHIFLAPGLEGMVLPLLSLVLGLYLARAYGSSFRGVLYGGAQPD